MFPMILTFVLRRLIPKTAAGLVLPLMILAGCEMRNEGEQAQKAETTKIPPPVKAEEKKVPSFEPEVEIPKEDDALARQQFKTKLLRRGPAPRKAPKLGLPKGVAEVEYPFGNLRLKAWVNRPVDETRKQPAVQGLRCIVQHLAAPTSTMILLLLPRPGVSHELRRNDSARI